MTHRRRRSSRRRRARRWPFLVGSALFAVVLALAILLADLPHRPAGGPVPVPDAVLDADSAGDAPTALAERPVYPYSIVEGGVETVEELRQQIARDPVVAAHYRDFDLSKARIERLETPRVAHVSYRMNDAVYWTRKPVFVPAGETIVTDGEIEARTRCANQLAPEPGPVSDDEPDPAVLETPRLPLRAVSLVERGIVAPHLNGGTPGPEGVGPPGVMPLLHPPLGPPFGPPVNPPVDPPYDPPGPEGDPDPPIKEIPEPGLTLLMLGLAAAAVRVRRRAASRARGAAAGPRTPAARAPSR
jgi:hypothetical protein